LLSLRAISVLFSFVLATVATTILYYTGLISKPHILYALIIYCLTTYFICYNLLNYLVGRHIKYLNDLIHSPTVKSQLINPPEDKKSELKIIAKFKQDFINFIAKKEQQVRELTTIAAFRKEFIADVSHELKTPIFAAQGFVHTLLDGAVEDPEVRIKFLKKAANSLDNLDLLVQDLLTLSNIEIGKIKMQMEYFAINELIVEVIDQLSIRSERKNISIQFKSKKKSIIVFADWQRIKQVVSNLISNAIKYTKDSGKINVEIDETDTNVKIRIIDNGVGIPTTELTRIFERFYRVDKSRSRERGGTGLGLAIVKHILEGHNSGIVVNSIEGKGSTFEFTLSKDKVISLR